MLNTKSFLTIDFGAGSLKLAEFEINEAGGLRLQNFAIKPLGLEGSQESSREKVILSALQGILAEKNIKAAAVNVCAPGFHVFSKFVKLPPVDASKVGQIIQYEAQQNVPFPLAEVVWDYQIMGTAATGELEVLLIAIKSEIVEGLFKITEQAKLQLNLCDASPAALCNAFRYNYGELEDCTMLLDIGAKTSNLLFFEKGKVFSRSINLGANTITQEFAAEAKLKFDEAERRKIAEGFVSLGGAYAEPENPDQAVISKIARQFMTKLHIQVNQTMQFYRGQQGGSAPQRLFLSGGASIMPYTLQFFAEKLKDVPIEYFNPFRNVQISPAVNLEELSRVAHSLGEVVGLALRNLATCPVELNLMPASTLRWQSFNQKKPYFIATMIGLVLVTFGVGYLFHILASNKEDGIKTLEPKSKEFSARMDQFKAAHKKLEKTQAEAGQIATWMQQRFYWGDFIGELRKALLRSELDMQKKLTAQKPNADVGVWIEQMISDPGLGSSALSPDAMMPGVPMPPMGMGRRGALVEATPPPPPQPQPDAGGQTPPADGQPVPATNNVIILVCRAVNLSSLDPSANVNLAYAVESEIKNSPFVDPKTSQFSGQIVPDDSNGTFTFTLTVVPLNPMKF